MPIVLIMMLFVLPVGLSLAAPPSGYYASAEGKTGTNLRQALHLIIRNHTVVPYSSGTRLDTSDALKVLDEDPANTNHVLLLYALRSEPKATFGLTSGWNREHMWPNSYGLDDTEPAFSDLHNLRAEDANVNSARGNKLYDVSSTNDSNYRVPGHGEAPQTSTDSNSWQPPDSVKGDIARAMFYMAVRYIGDAPNEPALFLTDIQSEVTSTTNLMSRLTTFLIWHISDPVDERERLRNDRVFYLYQHNRNPFVDRPEWVFAALGPHCSIYRDAVYLSITWRAEYSDARVQESPTLLDVWSTLTNQATRMGELMRLEMHFGPNSSTFYRLRLE